MLLNNKWFLHLKYAINNYLNILSQLKFYWHVSCIISIKTKNMRKIILAVLMLVIIQGAFAQFNLGVKLGTNINKISGTGFSDKFTYNYLAGGYVNIGLGKKWSIQPEVMFGQSTASTANNFSDVYSGNGASTQSNLKTNKLNTLSIPVLLTRGSGNFKLQAGVQYSKIIDNNKNLLQNGQSAFRSGDFSAVGGVWIKLPFHLNASARYVVGLNNISDITDNKSWKSQAIQLGIGYQF
jgi:hypothetical protein